MLGLSRCHWLLTIFTLSSAMVLAISSPAPAQQKSFGTMPKSSTQLELPDSLVGLSPTAQSGAQLKVSAEVEWNESRTAGRLHVRAQMNGGWHVYSVTQKAGGPKRTEIELTPSDQFELMGSFEPDSDPKIKRYDFYKVPVEEHYDSVIWTAPFRLKTGADQETFRIEGRLLGQVCDEQGGCIPLSTLDTKFVAKVTKVSPDWPLPASNDVAASAAPATAEINDIDKRRTPPIDGAAGTVAVAAATATAPLVPADTKFTAPPDEGYRAGSIHVTMTGQLQPAEVKAGGELELTISAKPDPTWHIYAYAAKDPQKISKPFLIAVSEPAGWVASDVQASEEPTVKETGIPIEPEQRYHEGPVDWKLKIKVPEGVKAGEYEVRGMIGYQTCTDQRCDPPAAAYFAAKVTIGNQGKDGVPLQFAPGKYITLGKFLKTNDGKNAAILPTNDATAQLPPGDNSPEATAPPVDPNAPIYDLTQVKVVESRSETTLYILGIAFVGGFLLNFMPCVLPVIGLKIMSFVQQAGAHRKRVFLLNAWYSIGMLAVFWTLALMASAASLGLARESLGWGQQFNYDGFTIPLLCVIFVMGLSFIGVWEIPIPGFVGSGKTGALAQHEGLAGAFFKGIVTTLLATPCSGPGLATALTWSANKPPHLVFLVFTFLGLGMALPYLLIGAFPNLIRFLPKPGAWMETFKQLMGFVLMGTVVYMFSLVSESRFIPTLALLFALWAGCWWVGRVPVTAEFLEKGKAWALATTLAVVVGWFGFVYESNRQSDLAWEPFSLAKLDEHLQARRTVLVDFTADWCPTCKVLERAVLNTQPIHQAVESNNVVTLVADWSNDNEEISRTLEALGSKQLPVIAIFPADDPYRPRTLTGAYTRRELLGKIEQATEKDRRLVRRVP